jgi:hypothetical protein
MIFQVASMVGAILILTAFAAQQFRHLEAETKTYQITTVRLKVEQNELVIDDR